LSSMGLESMNIIWRCGDYPWCLKSIRQPACSSVMFAVDERSSVLRLYAHMSYWNIIKWRLWYGRYNDAKIFWRKY